MTVYSPPTWVQDAACAEMDLAIFFPKPGHSARQAITVCRECPVRHQCLEHALTTPETHGIWGGQSERSRRKLRNRRRAA